MKLFLRSNSATIVVLSSLCLVFGGFLLAPTAAYGQPSFSLFGCFNGDTSCETTAGLSDASAVEVTNLDTGLGFFITGRLEYYANISPGGGISTLLPAVAGVRFTNGTITYAASNSGPINTSLDLIYFEYPTPGLSNGTRALSHFWQLRWHSHEICSRNLNIRYPHGSASYCDTSAHQWLDSFGRPFVGDDRWTNSGSVLSIDSYLCSASLWHTTHVCGG